VKAIITLGYTDYVIEVEDAFRIADIMGKAELYKADWSSEGTAHYIYPYAERDENHTWGLPVETIKLISDEQYRLAKLAGKPPKK